MKHAQAVQLTDQTEPAEHLRDEVEEATVTVLAEYRTQPQPAHVRAFDDLA